MRMRRLVVGALVVAAPVAAQAPSIVLLNGRIFTGDSTRPWAEALAIRGERIAAIGTTAEITRLARASTRRIDLHGRVAIAGINDAHDHLGDTRGGVNFLTSDSPTPDPSRAQVIDSLRALAARTPRGTWLTTQIGARLILDTTARRRAFDAAAPDHPVFLFTWWGHPLLMNSAALAALHITRDTPDPLGGWYERDAHGELTGRAEEYAKMLADRAVHAPRRTSDVAAELRVYAESALATGTTTVQDMTTAFDPAATVRAFRAADLPLRVRLIAVPMPNAAGRNTREWDTVKARVAPRVVVSGRKWILDGTPLEQTALLRQPYRPGYYGRLNFPLDTVRAMLVEALRPGAQPLHLHVAGDSTPIVVLNLMESLAPDSVWRSRRVRFEHGGGMIGAVLARAVRKGIVIAQPRAETAPFRAWRDSGMVVAYGSDALRNPFVHMLLAVAKPGGDTTQRISREDWVRIMTRGSAYAERTEHDKGMLVPGMLADVAVLSQDIFAVPAEALPGTRSVLTLIGGKVVRDALSAPRRH